MGTTAYAIGNANVINLAWDDAFGFNQIGSQYRTKFTGNKVETDGSDPFLAGGGAGFLVYIDGVAQPRQTLTNSAVYQDAWVGSEGTHTLEIIDDYGRVGTQRYCKWIQNIRITSSATESLSLPTDIIARKMMAPSSTFDSTAFQLEGPPLPALDTNLFGFDRTGISERLKVKSAKIGAMVYSAIADNTLYCRLYIKVGSDYVAGAVQSVALPIAGYNYVMLFTGLDDVTEHEAIFEAINSTSLLTNGTAVGIWGFTTSSGTGINAAHGYATYRDAWVLFSDSLGDSADANTGTGELGGFDYWFPKICNRNGVACINFAVNGARTDGISAAVAAKMASIPGGITVTKCFTTSGRNNRFSSWTPTQTHDAYVDLMTNIEANVSITCQINVIYMFYTGATANNATDDLHIAAEQSAVAGFLPDSRIVEWDPRTGPGLVQPDNYSGTGFTAHLAQSGNDLVAEWLAPTGGPDTTPPTVTLATAGMTLVMTPSEAITGVAFADFAMTGGHTLTGVSGSGAGPYTFTLTSPVAQGETVTGSFTAANTVFDTADVPNAMATFSGKAITNTSTLTVPDAPILTGVNAAANGISMDIEAGASDGGSAIIDYEVWHDRGAGYVLWRTIAAANIGNVAYTNDTGTSAGELVRIKARCRNVIGYSDFCVEVEVESAGPLGLGRIAIVRPIVATRNKTLSRM